MQAIRGDRRKILILCAIVGIALGVGGFCWYQFGLDDHAGGARCGTQSEQSQFTWSWLLMALGPYVGCIAVPVLWKRSPDLRLGFGFLGGFVASVLTGFALSSANDYENDLYGTLFALVIPVVGLLMVRYAGTKPGRVGGYVLGATTVPVLFFSLYAINRFCS